ncbi:MAG: GNAT family N-acetyltransferase [Methylobacterium sp.]|nr:GNAT family N-acetyltransferase [Methylobacterium sp.]
MGQEGGVIDLDIRVVEGASDKRSICRRLLAGLPEWFGRPEAVETYISEAGELPMVAAFSRDRPLGFALLKPQTQVACELALIAVDRASHGRGIGRRLVAALDQLARKRGARFMTVKTVDASFPNAEYDATRGFYRALGFEPLEVFPDLWGGHVPCLLMIRDIA